MYLESAKFSSDATERVLNALNASPSLTTLKIVNLCSAANLSKDDSCVVLAKFLASATSLEIFDIADTEGRRIHIGYLLAEGADSPGELTVHDQGTGKEFTE